MKLIEMKRLKRIMLQAGIVATFREEISSYGTGAHVRAPSKYKGKKVIVIVFN